MATPTTQFHVREPHVQLAYQIWTPPTKQALSRTPLFLVQGWSATTSDWSRFPYLVSTDRVVVTYDNRGMGQSILQQKNKEDTKAKTRSWDMSSFLSDPTALKFTMSQLAGDLASLIQTLYPNQRVHVMGCSMGGMMVQQLLIEYPHLISTAIIGCSTFGGSQAVLAPELPASMTAPPPNTNDPQAVLAHLTHLMSLNVTPTFIQQYPILFQHMIMESMKQKRPLDVIMAQFNAIIGFKSKSHLEKIVHYFSNNNNNDSNIHNTINTNNNTNTIITTNTNSNTNPIPRILIIHGDQDRVIPVENGRMLSQQLKSICQYVEMKNMGHVFWWMDPTHESARIVRTFLAQHDLNPPSIHSKL